MSRMYPTVPELADTVMTVMRIFGPIKPRRDKGYIRSVCEWSIVNLNKAQLVALADEIGSACVAEEGNAAMQQYISAGIYQEIKTRLVALKLWGADDL